MSEPQDVYSRAFFVDLPKYTCPFCGHGQPGGYCTRCGEWFDISQEATADHISSLPEEDDG